MFPHHRSSDGRFAQAHNWFVVQSHSAEIEHVRRSFIQDGTGIRCHLHLIVDPSASQTDDFTATLTSSLRCGAPIPVVSFQYRFKQSLSNTAARKVKREDSVAVVYMVKVKLPWGRGSHLRGRPRPRRCYARPSLLFWLKIASHRFG
jgi:hypothetical protein